MGKSVERMGPTVVLDVIKDGDEQVRGIGVSSTGCYPAGIKGIISQQANVQGREIAVHYPDLPNPCRISQNHFKQLRGLTPRQRDNFFCELRHSLTGAQRVEIIDS